MMSILFADSDWHSFVPMFLPSLANKRVILMASWHHVSPQSMFLAVSTAGKIIYMRSPKPTQYR